MQSLTHTLALKYEQMQADPLAALQQAITFLDREFDRSQLVAACEFSSLDSLADKDKTGFFGSGRTQSTNAGDSDSSKVRRGKVGGYRDYFTADQIEHLDTLVTNKLDPWFEYR